jgi:hypothetical protein
LVFGSLCAVCVIPLVARLLAAIREALKIPIAALRREALFEVRRLPEELREALRPTLRPTIRYLTLRQARTLIEAYGVLLEDGYRINAQRIDLGQSLAAMETAAGLAEPSAGPVSHSETRSEMHTKGRSTQMAVVER